MTDTPTRVVTAPEVRAAKKYLERRGFDTEEISPRRFAMAAKEGDVSFATTLQHLSDRAADDGDE